MKHKQWNILNPLTFAETGSVYKVGIIILAIAKTDTLIRKKYWQNCNWSYFSQSKNCCCCYRITRLAKYKVAMSIHLPQVFNADRWSFLSCHYWVIINRWITNSSNSSCLCHQRQTAKNLKTFPQHPLHNVDISMSTLKSSETQLLKAFNKWFSTIKINSCCKLTCTCVYECVCVRVSGCTLQATKIMIKSS